MAAVKNARLFTQLFLTGIDIDVPCANKYAVEFALKKAEQSNNKKLIKQIMELSRSPITNAEKFQKRAKILMRFDGIKTGTSYNQLLISTVKNPLFSKAYSLKDILKTITGMEFCLNVLLPEFDTLNLFNKITAVHVPVYFIQGKLDAVAPYQIARKFYEYLEADKKQFIPFENSAHMPHYEEPGKFGKLLKETIGGN